MKDVGYCICSARALTLCHFWKLYCSCYGYAIELSCEKRHVKYGLQVRLNRKPLTLGRGLRRGKFFFLAPPNYYS